MSISIQALSYPYDHDAVWYGIPVWSVGVSCPSYVPSLPLAHPQPTSLGVGKGVRETALMLHEHCSAVAKTLGVINTIMATNATYSTMRTAIGKVNSIPVRSNTPIFLE